MGFVRASPGEPLGARIRDLASEVEYGAAGWRAKESHTEPVEAQMGDRSEAVDERSAPRPPEETVTPG